MTETFQRIRIEVSVEKFILLSLIVSGEFIEEVADQISPEFFKNKYIQKIIPWILAYYRRYVKAPGNHVWQLLEQHKKELDEDEADNMEEILKDCADRFTTDEKINLKYTTDRAIKYFEQRELELLNDEISYHLERGDSDAAKHALGEYRRAPRVQSGMVDIFDDDLESRFWRRLDYESDFFQFPGMLGQFLGPFERSWLVGVAGKYKLGKTWFAQEFGVMGMLQRLRVGFFSLEMPEEKMFGRIWSRVSASNTTGTDWLYPVWDCVKNQDGTCDNIKRASRVPLVWDPNDGKPDMRLNSEYKSCAFCKNHPEFQNEYQMAVWFEPRKRPELDRPELGRVKDRLKRRFKERFMLKCYPKFTANIEQITRDIEIAEQKMGYAFDMIIIDHADIIAPERDVRSWGVEKEDRTWIALGQLAAQKNVLTVVPTQVTKEALEAFQMRERHMARWSGKLGHVEMMIGINQTAFEKRQHLMRVNLVLPPRHREVPEGQSVVLMQNLGLGQFHLDSMMYRPPEEEDFDDGE
jgi:hypothetical protein